MVDIIDLDMAMDQYLLNPINSIFRGMNIQKSQLFWCELQVPGFWHTAIYVYIYVYIYIYMHIYNGTLYIVIFHDVKDYMF